MLMTDVQLAGITVQIQTEIGEGHANLVDVHQLLLTPTHLALSMEYARGGSLTSYVADKWQHADPSGLVMSEDEARYFFKVGALQGQNISAGPVLDLCSCSLDFHLFLAAIHQCHQLLPQTPHSSPVSQYLPRHCKTSCSYHPPGNSSNIKKPTAET